MALNKKGIYFTLMSLVFVLLFAFTLTLPKYNALGKKTTNLELRIDTMEDFLQNLEKDISRSLYISSFRSLLAFEQHIVNTGEFLSSTEVFSELIRNGTLYNNSIIVMQDSTFDAWLLKISTEASKVNIIADFKIHNISIYQDNPWEVKSKVELEIHIQDIGKIAEWRINKSITSAISIQGFEDPLYIVNGFGRLTNNINKTPYLNFVSGNDPSNLISHANKSYYAANTNAPSFLQRLVNDSSPSPYGIESMVNLEMVSGRSLPLYTSSSIIDYLYWQGIESGDYRLNNTPSWMRIDASHLSNYNASGIAYID